MDAARCFQLHPCADTAEAQYQHQCQTECGHDTDRRNQCQRTDGSNHTDHSDAGAGTFLIAEQGSTHHVQERMRILRGNRYVYIFFTAGPENHSRNEHQDARNTEGNTGTEFFQEDRHQQGCKERTEVDDPVKRIKHFLRQTAVTLIELIADKR